MSVQEGHVPFPFHAAGKDCQTYYKTVGDLRKGIPLVILHGGPGTAHDYLLGLTALHEQHGIPLIFYDQLGCGKSTALPEKAGDTSFWTEELFRTELDNLLDAFNLRESGFDILGHSWGGMLGSAYAATRPKGLRKLVIANSPASMPRWIEDTHTRIKQLPEPLQQAIENGNREEKYDSPDYMEATMAFAKNFLCWKEPFPCAEFMSAIGHILGDTTVSGTILTALGVDRLQQIEAPTLLLNGTDDVAQDLSVKPFFQNIPRVKWVTLNHAGHYMHVDALERVVEAVNSFLTA
ncbi:MAG: hypothetical protein Q9162_006395 [Coniocarpon cinnabarinum]